MWWSCTAVHAGHHREPSFRRRDWRRSGRPVDELLPDANGASITSCWNATRSVTSGAAGVGIRSAWSPPTGSASYRASLCRAEPRRFHGARRDRRLHRGICGVVQPAGGRGGRSQAACAAAAKGPFLVGTSGGDLTADQVVVATGPYQVAADPARWPSGCPTARRSSTPSQYRSPGQLPPGAVLVVGTGQSGCQIAEDLHLAGRRVHLAVGSAPRVARLLPRPGRGGLAATDGLLRQGGRRVRRRRRGAVAGEPLRDRPGRRAGTSTCEPSPGTACGCTGG